MPRRGLRPVLATAAAVLLASAGCAPTGHDTPAPEGTQQEAGESVLSGDAGAGGADAGEAPREVACTRRPGDAVGCRAFDASGALFCAMGGLAQPERRVITRPEEWAALWSQAFSRLGAPPPLPAVDFSREHVVLAALGERPASGFDVLLEVSAASGVRTATVTERAPSPGCPGLAVITTPFALQRIPAEGGPVRFEEQRATCSCGG
jgi:hypothetical protein